MDFAIDPKLETRLARIRTIIEEDIRPLEHLLLTGTPWPQIAEALAPIRKKVKAEGLWAPNLPKDIGGTFTSLGDLALTSEVCGFSPFGHYTFGCQAPDAGNAELLHLHGSHEQHETYLKPLAAGDIRSCFAMTEPHTAGSNPTLLDTMAVLDGDEWVIDGRKWFTTAADGSAFTIIMAVTDPDAAPHARASMIIVPIPTPGFTILRNIPVMGHSGSGYFSHSEVEFKNCRVPATNLVGKRGHGFALAQDRLGPGRIQHCMRWLGICQRTLDEMCRYVSRRQISSRETLADKQIIQSWIAESAADIAAARTLTLETAWKLDTHGFKAAKESVSLIKFHSANALQRVVDRALQAHGALGMTDDTILAFYYREERAARIYDGPDEVHKMSVAKQILRRYRNIGTEHGVA